MVVKEEFNKLGLSYSFIDYGIAEINDDMTTNQREELKMRLHSCGFRLMDDENSHLIEKIRNVVVEMVHYADDLPTISYADYISKKLNLDYKVLSNVFSEVKGITIYQYITIHKMEKLKELLLYNEYSIKTIAHKLHYKSPAHLSKEFKKIYGLSPSFYKELKSKRSSSL
jgi:AraC-like DNA-binding protein